MRALVIFDSTYGNTKKIAETIVKELGKDATIVAVADFKPKDLEGKELLIVGSPINGWRPTEKIMAFLAELKQTQLKGINAASFDTRVKLFIHGDAAKKIAAALEKAGAEIVSKPRAFYVKGTKGPLFEGEVQRAESFGAELSATKEKGKRKK